MGSEPRVLVCEDDQSIRELLVQLLGRRGFVVDTARTGEEALHCIASETYQAILLDMKLPNPDGFEIVERLRHERPDVLARTIIVTASPRAMKDPPPGTGGFLAKPFDLMELAETIDRVVRRSGDD
ncbi:MAG TPA: response regulator [Thermoanaerobaculia bacterium]